MSKKRAKVDLEMVEELLPDATMRMEMGQIVDWYNEELNDLSNHNTNRLLNPKFITHRLSLLDMWGYRVPPNVETEISTWADEYGEWDPRMRLMPLNNKYLARLAFIFRLDIYKSVVTELPRPFMEKEISEIIEAISHQLVKQLDVVINYCRGCGLELLGCHDPCYETLMRGSGLVSKLYYFSDFYCGVEEHLTPIFDKIPIHLLIKNSAISLVQLFGSYEPSPNPSGVEMDWLLNPTDYEMPTTPPFSQIGRRQALEQITRMVDYLEGCLNHLKNNPLVRTRGVKRSDNPEIGSGSILVNKQIEPLTRLSNPLNLSQMAILEGMVYHYDNGNDTLTVGTLHESLAKNPKFKNTAKTISNNMKLLVDLKYVVRPFENEDYIRLTEMGRRLFPRSS